MNSERKKFYDNIREEFKGDDARSVGWVNNESLNKRFWTVLDHIDCYSEDKLVLDYGCGVALNLYQFLGNPKNYVGVDCNRGSLEDASKKFGIPIVDSFCDTNSFPILMEDEYQERITGSRYDIIVVNGVFQEFDSIAEVEKTVVTLASLLKDNGQLICLTPSNRNFHDVGVLRLSVYDVASIVERIKLPYEIYLGELGEHIIFKIKNI